MTHGSARRAGPLIWQICTTDLIGAEAHRPAAVNSPTLNSWGRIGKVTSRGGSEYNHRPRHQLTVWQSNATRHELHSERPSRLWRPLVFVAHQKAGLPGQVAWLGESRKAKPCGCSLTRSLAPFPQPRSTSRWRRRRGALPPAGLRTKWLESPSITAFRQNILNKQLHINSYFIESHLGMKGLLFATSITFSCLFDKSSVDNKHPTPVTPITTPMGQGVPSAKVPTRAEPMIPLP